GRRRSRGRTIGSILILPILMPVILIQRFQHLDSGLLFAVVHAGDQTATNRATNEPLAHFQLIRTFVATSPQSSPYMPDLSCFSPHLDRPASHLDRHYFRGSAASTITSSPSRY